MLSGSGSNRPEDFFGAPVASPQPVSEPLPTSEPTFVQIPGSGPNQRPNQVFMQTPVQVPGQASFQPQKNRISFGMGLASLLLSIVYPICAPMLELAVRPTATSSYSASATASQALFGSVFILTVTLSLIFGIIAIVKSKAKPQVGRPKSRSGQVLGIIGIVISGWDILMVIAAFMAMAMFIFSFL
jgi:hypothetical protein